MPSTTVHSTTDFFDIAGEWTGSHMWHPLQCQKYLSLGRESCRWVEQCVHWGNGDFFFSFFWWKDMVETGYVSIDLWGMSETDWKSILKGHCY